MTSLPVLKEFPGYTEEVKKMGVEIVDSIADLLRKVDVVLLETNDGRLHLDQALQVLKARKPVFIDKPIATSLVGCKGHICCSKTIQNASVFFFVFTIYYRYF
jgi:predicted dehydrogenase